MLEVCEIIVFLLLFLISIFDIKNREFSIILPCILLLFLIVYQCISRSFDWLFCGAGMVPGALLILFHYLTRGGVGLGDGIVIGVLGFHLGLWENLSLLFLSLVLEMIFAVGVLVKKKIQKEAVSRHMTIPFIPFVTGGYLLLMFS